MIGILWFPVVVFLIVFLLHSYIKSGRRRLTAALICGVSGMFLIIIGAIWSYAVGICGLIFLMVGGALWGKRWLLSFLGISVGQKFLAQFLYLFYFLLLQQREEGEDIIDFKIRNLFTSSFLLRDSI